MKKLLLALAVLLLTAPQVIAAVTGVTDPQETLRGFNDSDVEITTVTVTGTTGSYQVEAEICGFLSFVMTDPGATAPDDNYDVVITDDDVVDIMGGELANRDTSTSEQAMPKMGNSYGPRFVCGYPTITISNQATADAIMGFKFYVH